MHASFRCISVFRLASCSLIDCFSFVYLCAQGGDAGGLGLGGGGGEKDALLLLGLFTLVLVGSLAQDLAGDTWEKVQKEVKDETAAREANPEAYAAEAGDGSEGFASLLPFNVTAVTQGALSIVPEVCTVYMVFEFDSEVQTSYETQDTGIRLPCLVLLYPIESFFKFQASASLLPVLSLLEIFLCKIRECVSSVRKSGAASKLSLTRNGSPR
jgi:hypothetical protein